MAGGREIFEHAEHRRIGTALRGITGDSEIVQELAHQLAARMPIDPLSVAGSATILSAGAAM